MTELPTAIRGLPTRLPFTVAMLAAVLIVASVSGTFVRALGPLVARLGFDAARHDSVADWFALLVSVFFVAHPHFLIGNIAALAVGCGACELRLGTRRAIAACWLGHITSVLGAVFVAFVLGRLGVAWAGVEQITSDIGGRSGALGAAGAVIASWPAFVRNRVAMGALLLFGVLVVIDPGVTSVRQLIALAAGLALGGWWERRAGRGRVQRVPRQTWERDQRAPLLGWGLGVAGLVSVLSAFVLPEHAGFARLAALLPLDAPHAPRHLLFAMGIVLLLLARGLGRRQRAAWWGALIVLIAGLALHALLGASRASLLLSGLLLIGLLAWRQEFTALPTTPDRRAAWRWPLTLVVAVPCYAFAGLYALRSQFLPAPRLGSAVREFGARLLFAGDVLAPANHRATWFLESVTLIAWGGLVAAVLGVLRLATAPRVSADEHRQAGEILRRHGWASTSYMTLWDGNAVLLVPGAGSYVAYRVASGVAVALGDPVGPEAGRSQACRAFASHCGAQGWDHVFYGATGSAAADLTALGYHRVQIGEEAVVSLDALDFRGKHWQTVRSAIHRAAREGLGFRLYEGGRLPESLRAQCAAISAQWLAGKELPEMEFTLGTLRDMDDPEVRVTLAVDAAGTVHAFADWLPIYARRGWVIDLMRRRPGCMTGAMEFLIASALLAFQQRGDRVASLSVAPLA
ncbi:MAG: DUF2156 domain-containing protein, partial [Candidatus Eiseniibacteriota bacterium]